MCAMCVNHTPPPPRDVKSYVLQGDGANGISNDPGVQHPRQVVIPVDCVVPDMPVSMDDDSCQLNTMTQKYASGTASVTTNGTHTSQYMQNMHPSHAHTLGVQTASGTVRANSIEMNGLHASHLHTTAEPVVDLSVPTPYAQPDYMGAGLAPRQGQDIFDTWYAVLYQLSTTHLNLVKLDVIPFHSSASAQFPL